MLNLQCKKGEKGGYQSGQMGQTVNLLVFTFGGSNPSPPTKTSGISSGIFLYHLSVFAQIETMTFNLRNLCQEQKFGVYKEDIIR